MRRGVHFKLMSSLFFDTSTDNYDYLFVFAPKYDKGKQSQKQEVAAKLNNVVTTNI